MARIYGIALAATFLVISACSRSDEPAAQVGATPSDPGNGNPSHVGDEPQPFPQPGQGSTLTNESTDGMKPPEIATPPVPEPAGDIAAAKQALVGTWEITSVNDGEASDGERFVFTADALTLEMSAGAESATYQLDLTATPHHLDIRLEQGAEVFTIPGIYEITGDKLTLCSANAPGGERPTAFEAAQGRLFHLQRFKSTVAEVVTIGRDMPWVGSGAVAFHPSEPIAAATLGGRILLWNLQANKKIEFIDSTNLDSVGSLEFSADGAKLLASAGVLAKGVELFDVATHKSEHVLPDATSFAHFSPDGTLVATRGASGCLELWEVSTWQLQHSFESDDSQYVADADFNVDGSLIASVGATKNLAHVWNVTTHELAAKFEGAEKWRRVTFHPDGNQIALVSEYGPTEIWDVSRKQLVRTLQGSGSADNIAFSPDGKRAAGGGEAIYLWDVDTGEPAMKLPRGPWGSGTDRLAFDREGKMLGVARAHFVNIFALDPSAAPREPATWPPPLTRAEETERGLAEMLAHFHRARAEMRSAERREIANILSIEGTALLSWRVKLLPYMEDNILYKQFDRKQAWDSEANAKPVADGARVYGTPGVDTGKTIWLMATGPDTWCPDQEPLKKIPDGGGTILVVQASPERAVPWAAPQDFVFDPADPWAGLPKTGFVAIFADGRTRFVRPITPADTLKALFTATGGEQVELDKFTESTMDRFLYGP